MRKLLGLLLILTIGMTCTTAAFADMGVQVIGGPETEIGPVSLDDVELNVDVEIDGYAILCPTEFAFSGRLGFYLSGHPEPIERYILDNHYYYSGAEAEFAILRVDLTNLATIPRNFLSSCEVKAIFDDKYEYGGWFYQSNYNNGTSTNYKEEYLEDTGKQNQRWVIHEADQFVIDPMYQGHYVFGCTLPNSVVNSKAPLRMIITIDGNEITYNIRK